MKLEIIYVPNDTMNWTETGYHVRGLVVTGHCKESIQLGNPFDDHVSSFGPAGSRPLGSVL
jgi:hypothetical protein